MKTPYGEKGLGSIIDLPNFLCCNVMKKVIQKKMWSGQRSARGLLAKPMTRQVMVHIRFFMYQGY
jgi:hypothetical protein